ncbi:MAG: hypothetical protein ACREL3_13365 [Gemmatimonadales bacterium]
MQRTAVRLAAALVSILPLCSLVAPIGAQTEAASTMAHGHMSFTESRPGTAADTARALAVVSELRNAIAPYRTIEAAEQAGYRGRRDPEMVKAGKLLHLGRRPGRVTKGFDSRSPQALLFRRKADGTMALAGAMFVAPLSATTDDLDAMIPLSVAHWHRHMNVCVSPDRANPRRFPRATTAEACTAAGGRFRAESRYMVHVMTDAGSDLARAFPQGQDEMAGMEMQPGLTRESPGR